MSCHVATCAWTGRLYYIIFFASFRPIKWFDSKLVFRLKHIWVPTNVANDEFPVQVIATPVIRSLWKCFHVVPQQFWMLLVAAAEHFSWISNLALLQTIRIRHCNGWNVQDYQIFVISRNVADFLLALRGTRYARNGTGVGSRSSEFHYAECTHHVKQ